MQPIWKVNCGEFFGWRQDDQLYDVEGHHVGYFQDDTAFSLRGEYIGEMVDDERMGRPVGRMRPSAGSRGSRGQIRTVPRADLSPRPSKAWEDPELD
ncbi:MAG: hypothetical protein U9R79_04430 [Armatimonadota bacterium]|nr:hypothetical protein [Armatimonadota bacterium]